MLNVLVPKKRNITEYYEKYGVIFFKSDAGLLRVIPIDKGIFRVSFSEDGNFDKRQGEDYQSGGRNSYEITEDDEKYIIKTQLVSAFVDKVSAAISIYDRSGNHLMSEDKRCPREMEKITLYRTVGSDKAVVEEIETADGKKKKIKAADKEECGSAYRTRTYFDFEEDEILLGFGQSERDEWNLRHTTYYGNQANRKIAIPFFISTNNYGVLLSTESPFLFSEKDGKAYIQTEADCYQDYFFIGGGNLFDVIKGFRKISGRAAMLPAWCYGYIQSQERYESQKEILDIADEFRNREIGLDCIVQDWMSWEDNMWGQKSFDKKRFPDPKKMTDELHKKGIRLMLSIWPNMSSETANNKELKEKGLLLPGVDIYDAFSEEGRKLYWSQVKRDLYPMGIDAWWCDSSEPITPEWEHLIEPEDGDKYNEFKRDAENIMPYEKADSFGKYHARTIFEGQRECSLKKRVVNLTRSGWAGSQKYGTILWSGDISASWECLRRQIKAGLQMAVSGMPYWTMDTGAFFVKKGIQWYWDGEFEKGIDEDYKKLYVRWLEFAAFLPVFRAHGTDVRREPWAFGDEGDAYYEAIKSTITERYRLLPYLYSIGAGASIEDGMIIRPLLFDFPGDRNVRDITDQFMLGPSLMVCPLTSAEDTRRVYLPAGMAWFDYYTGDIYDGGQYIRYECSLDRIPVFVPEGSIIPVKEPGMCTDDMKEEDITLRIYPGRDAFFELYEDEGDGYGYEEGEYTITHIKWKDSEEKVSHHTTGDVRFRNGKIKVDLY
ncbi:MAG: DUF5110 domain-containing protein [Butyrivibrio sp.]|nr:DUF5110 domain-containing protein [Butyrivibrio sp.]